MPYRPTLSRSNELWRTAHEWLTLCGNRINKNYCKEEIATHPDYPALTAVVDFLDTGNMAYKALQADASYIHEFNYPLLAHIRQPGNEYMHIIDGIAAWDEQIEITRHWTGIVLFAQKGAQWQNEQNASAQKDAVRNKALTAILVIIGLVVFSFSTFRLLAVSSSAANGFISFFGLLSLIGLVVSLFALGTELGFQSQLVKQVCGILHPGGCEQVLKSRYARGFAGITPADASVLYFAAQFIAYLVSPLYPGLLPVLAILAFGGIAIAALSIYLQAFRLKQWCALCLGIVATLLLQALLAFWMPVSAVGYAAFAGFALLLFLLSPVFLTVKKLVRTNAANKIKLIELKKWKLDAGLFMSQWQQEEEVDASVWQNDLVVGHSGAPLQITVACSTYCGPCASAHKQMDALLRRFASKVKVQIRFLCTVDNPEDKRTIATKAILEKAAIIKDNDQLESMLTDWFEWMNYDKWAEKWAPGNPASSNGEEVKSRLLQHSQWIQQSNIAFTPTFFVNGRRLPGRYSLADLEILIPQLAGYV